MQKDIFSIYFVPDSSFCNFMLDIVGPPLPLLFKGKDEVSKDWQKGGMWDFLKNWGGQGEGEIQWKGGAWFFYCLKYKIDMAIP